MEAVSVEEAEEIASNNTDASVNFMALTTSGNSEVNEGNSGKWNITQLDGRGSTSAAHEFGHLLGYTVPKGNIDYGVYGNEQHASRKIKNENYFIMGDGNLNSEGYKKRRVDPSEYSRLNGGWGRRANGIPGGVYTPTATTKVLIVDPSKPITNHIYK